ncbi:MAG: glycosyltransferase [Prevotella sp.]|nr:glycosyltransferase [Prevotella sp.]
MKNLSILIPTYNDLCVKLVKYLQQQADAIGISYEIIVADDASTDEVVKEGNRVINCLKNCRLVECEHNRGRAAIRNFLVRQSVMDWLLFVDGDMTVCKSDFLRCYAESEGADVIDGGLVIGKYISGNLRSLYEKSAEKDHTLEKRQQSPYLDFHTANFLIRRDLILRHPFDERFRHYGYEDVLLGKDLEQHHVSILHIYNPLSFEIFETNEEFVSKTEEGLRTLHRFREELRGYSRMIALADKLPRPLIRLWHTIFSGIERRHLTGTHPTLLIFNCYRIGYFLSLD